MRRRDFLTALGGAAATWPLAARAQQPNRVRRVGALIGGSENDPPSQRYAAAFREGLAKLGWMDGRNLRIDLRFAADDLDRISRAAAELVSLAPDVIFVSSGATTRAMQEHTQTIPTVYIGPGPEAPSSAVVVKNIARPEGNITGFPILYPSIAGKWVELLKETDPRVVRVAVINGRVPTAAGFAGLTYVASIAEAAPALAVKLMDAIFDNAAELEREIDSFAAEPNGGLIVIPGTFTSTRDNRDLIRRLAENHRLPTVHWDNSYPAEGGLMSYGSNAEDLFRRAASYVDRILRGAKVSELPVERPTKFELIINVKAAKAIGLTIPEAFLLRADELIE
jgi:putative tryptophan/tyrosine transport system substrate-binding protein